MHDVCLFQVCNAQWIHFSQCLRDLTTKQSTISRILMNEHQKILGLVHCTTFGGIFGCSESVLSGIHHTTTQPG